MTQATERRKPAARRAGVSRATVALLMVGAFIAGAALGGAFIAHRMNAKNDQLRDMLGMNASECSEHSFEAPYAEDSFWNTPIPDDAEPHEKSQAWIDRLTSSAGTVTSDVDQYTIAVFCADASTPMMPAELTGYFSDYSTGKRQSQGEAPTIDEVPVPNDFAAPSGTDGQVVVVDIARGLEFGWWQASIEGGRLQATNGYVHKLDSDGRFADALAGRGAGLPYLGGLVLEEEIVKGNVPHALSFAYKWPSKSHIFPASKSDGLGTPEDLPEGARLQLNPDLSDDQLRDLGVKDVALPVAHALQKYGMYVVDNSGSSKLYVESSVTAEHPADVGRDMLGTLSWDLFRVVEEPSS